MSESKIFLLNFWSVARYEIVYLFRDWFFRVFAALSIVSLIVFNIIFYAGVTLVPHIFYGMPSFIPYANLVLLNIAQVIFIIFVIADLIKREKEHDSIKVIHTREIHNPTYLLGKIAGIFITFIALNFCIIIVAVIIHVISDSVNFIFIPYVIYFLIIPIPTIVYIIGITLFVINIIRNQAIAIILLLVYSLITLFYLGDKHFYLFDFITFELPLVYSEFSGIANDYLILLQRSIYIFLGIAFIFFSILVFQRLPQSKKATNISYLTMIGATVFSFLLIYLFVNTNFNNQYLRKQMIKLNESILNRPNISIKSNSINLDHQGNEIQADAKLFFTNENDIQLDRIYFFLNPGLSVSKIVSGNQEISFNQNFHVIDIHLDQPLEPNQADSICIYYSGSIYDEASYLDIPDEIRNKPYKIWYYNIAKKYFFLTTDYVLLSVENLWYPVASLKSSNLKSLKRKMDFVKYELSVKTEDDLTAISQGKVLSVKDGKFIFKPETPLTQLSLVIGDYETKSILVDSIEYNLHTLKNHDDYLEFFSGIDDTLGAIIRNVKYDYEQKLGLEYPFKRLNVLEVPIQFYTYTRLWTIAQEIVQPEQAWLHENGILLPTANFYQQRQLEEAYSKYSRKDRTEKEIKIRSFNRIVENAFLEKNQFYRFMMPFRMEISFDYQPDYNIFSNYYSYCNYFFSSEWPMFNSSVEYFLYNRVNSSPVLKKMFAKNLSPDEKVCQELKLKSFLALLHSNLNYELLANMIRVKNNYLNKQIQTKIEDADYFNFVAEQINRDKFSNSPVNTLVDIIENKCQIQLNSIVETWYHNNRLPGFIYSNITLTKIQNDKDYNYHVGFEIANPEDTPGLIEISFGYKRKDMFTGRYSAYNNNETKTISIDKQQTKQIGIRLNAKPRSININSLLAQNIPLAFMVKLKEKEFNFNTQLFDGEIIIDKKIWPKGETEIIIDNEDPGFEIVDFSQTNWFTHLFHVDQINENQYTWTINYYDPPQTWQRLKSPAFYGKYIHSAFYVGAGEGDKKAIWRVNIPDGGHYSVYTCIFDRSKLLKRWDKGKLLSKFLYSIFHDNDTTKIELDVQQTDPSEVWNYLCEFYFPKGNAKVELSNKTDGKVVIADAIKFVKN
ncbi:hypothetical protein ACFLSX_02990 [Calditrichota bacterium]